MSRVAIDPETVLVVVGERETKNGRFVSLLYAVEVVIF